MTAIIITLILVLVPAAIAGLMSHEYSYDASITNAVFAFLFVGCVAGVIMAMVFVPLAGVTGGFFDNYSTGTREGFITKVSVKGFIWKTNEAQIQVGTGQMAALQEPFSFSISDPDMALMVESYLGEKVRIEYKQWLIQPYRYGETSYDCVSILPIND